MLFPLVVIDELPQFDLHPIHDLISSLNLRERFLLVGLHEDLNEHLYLFVFPFAFDLLILSQILEIVLDLVPEEYAIFLHEFCIGGLLLVHSSMRAMASRKKGISS